MGRSADEDRFRRIYQGHHPAVLAYCRRRAPREDAFDACADTFVVAWRRMEEVPDGEDALPWLYGVARRVLANRRRGIRRLGRFLEQLDGMREVGGPLRPEVQVIRHEEERRVLAGLSRLRPGDREVLRLAAWEGLSNREIATVLRCSSGAADKRLQRARRRLAAELGGSAGRSTGLKHQTGGAS